MSRPGIPVAALAVVAGGVAAALHIGKLPPAVPALQASLGIGLVQAGFLLSLVQVAGMSLGLSVGLMADAIGLRRSMLGGLALLALAKAVDGGYAVTEPLLHDPWLAPLRDNPRFIEILRRAQARRDEALAVFRAEGGERLLGLPSAA